MSNEMSCGIYSVKCKNRAEFGLPFCAISDDAAIVMAKASVKDVRDHVNLDDFVLVKIGTYYPDMAAPLCGKPEPRIVQEFADLDFKEEESE